ncbi:MAG: Rpp14/Pop5 family protein [Thermoplasmata archaeon]
MVVRDKVGRKRYVVFCVDSESSLSHEDFERAMVSMFREKGVLRSVRPRLIDFDGRTGIMRCAHTGKEEVIGLLNRIVDVKGTEVRIETVKTSGTLRKARTVVKGLASGR